MTESPRPLARTPPRGDRRRRSSPFPEYPHTLVTRERAHARNVDERPEGHDVDQSATTPRTRASDVERAEIVTMLHRGGGDGRLTLDEVDRRTAAAYAARFRDQLGPLVADLPDPPAAVAAEGWVGMWHGLLRQSRASLLGAATDPTAMPTRRQQILAALAVLAILMWLAVWILFGFGFGFGFGVIR